MRRSGVRAVKPKAKRPGLVRMRHTCTRRDTFCFGVRDTATDRNIERLEPDPPRLETVGRV